MFFIGLAPSPGWRRHRDERTRKRHAKAICTTLIAALMACAYANNARANPSEPVVSLLSACAPGARLPSFLATTKCAATQEFTSSFIYSSISPVLTLRPNSFLIDDITSGIPDLHFDVPPSTPVLLTSLTPPTSVDALTEIGAPLAPPVIAGIASMYDPIDSSDKDAGGLETASGEHYDELAWTAAIRTDLRARFGGVSYGKNYEPTFALVESGNKRIIVKINDVGPLRPGRIIDLNKRAMRYFDPTLQLGLIKGIRVTPLAGTNWTTGPVGSDDETIKLAGDFAL